MSTRNSNVQITKSSGEKVPFNEQKLRNSLRRSQCDPDLINDIVRQVSAMLVDGLPTDRIHSTAYKLLKKNSHTAAARYKLKKSLFELGPTGYLFERYVGEIFKFDGYHVQVGQTCQGQCVTHEIDVLADLGNERNMVECKFHNHKGYSCNVKIPLYIQSRFLDLVSQWQLSDKNANKKYVAWVATNTRFTADAIQYAECMNMRLLSWDYPPREGLKHRIDKNGLHPITSLVALRPAEKKRLLNQGTILCQQLLTKPTILQRIGIDERRQDRVIAECTALVKPKQSKE